MKDVGKGRVVICILLLFCPINLHWISLFWQGQSQQFHSVRRAEVTPWQAASIRSRPSYFWVVRLLGHLDQLSLNTDRCLPIRNGVETPGKVCPRGDSFDQWNCFIHLNQVRGAHPINLCNSLGSGLSDPAPLHWMRQEPWLESAINFPFCELHCVGGLLSSCSGIRTSGTTHSFRRYRIKWRLHEEILKIFNLCVITITILLPITHNAKQLTHDLWVPGSHKPQYPVLCPD